MVLTRLEQLKSKLAAQGLDGLVITQAKNRRYLSGFTGSEGFLLVLVDKSYLCTDFRYMEQAALQAPGWEIVKIDAAWWETIKQLWPKGRQRLGFEAQHLIYDNWNKLTKVLPTVDLVPTSGLVESLRVQKDEQELILLKQAIALADKGAAYLRSSLVPGYQERDIALELEFFLRRHGAEGAAFPFIVASGVRGSLPHGEASEKRLELGELVTVDFGAVYQGYHSDLTRTFSLGLPTSKQKSIYEIVLEAQLKAIAAAGPGVPCAYVDRAARDVIAKAGYDQYFGHATGHGVGLAIHEEPRLSPQASDILLPGMVVTVEPGIYLPGWGGVRTEDVVLITKQGAEVLSQAPKETFVL
ncbi:MAG: aminopeptidase P family protein [Firmicutes bacterium]|jgi:Xaa-Pro aminopeptidase|nr:aminopeptidase P family protein [Bacillota bacterium]